MKFVFDLDGTSSFDLTTIVRSYRDTLGLLVESLAQKSIIGLNGGMIYKGGKFFEHKEMELVA